MVLHIIKLASTVLSTERQKSNKCNFDFQRFLEVEYEHGTC